VREGGRGGEGEWGTLLTARAYTRRSESAPAMAVAPYTTACSPQRMSLPGAEADDDESTTMVFLPARRPKSFNTHVRGRRARASCA
jgi:hypothetical protein